MAFEVHTFDDALSVLTQNMAHYVPEAIIILRDTVDEIDSNQIQELLSALNSYLENGAPSDRLFGNILDILIEIFKVEDIEQFKLRDLTRNVTSALNLGLLVRGSKRPAANKVPKKAPLVRIDTFWQQSSRRPLPSIS